MTSGTHFYICSCLYSTVANSILRLFGMSAGYVDECRCSQTVLYAFIIVSSEERLLFAEFTFSIFLNLKDVNSNNPKVKVTCCNIINQLYYIFPLNN